MIIVLNTMALKWKSELDLESNLSYCDNDEKSNDINLNLTLGCFFRPGHVLEPIKSNISPCRISLLWSVSLVSLHSFSSSCIENKEGDVERACYLLEIQGIAKICSRLKGPITFANVASSHNKKHVKMTIHQAGALIQKFFSFNIMTIYHDISMTQKRITFQRSNASIPSLILSAA